MFVEKSYFAWIVMLRVALSFLGKLVGEGHVDRQHHESLSRDEHDVGQLLEWDHQQTHAEQSSVDAISPPTCVGGMK